MIDRFFEKKTEFDSTIQYEYPDIYIGCGKVSQVVDDLQTFSP